MRKVLAPIAAFAAGFALALPFFFPYEAVVPRLVGPRLEAAGLRPAWGPIRYRFPRSLEFRALDLRGVAADRPFTVEIDRLTVTPALSSLWGRPAATVAVEMAGGEVLLDLSAPGGARSVEGVAAGIDLARFPVGIVLPWRVGGRADGRGSLRWTGSPLDGAGTLEFEVRGVEVDGVRWLEADWPTIRADRAEGRVEAADRRLAVSFRTEGGNCPARADGVVLVRDPPTASGLDLAAEIRPAPEVVASLGEAGESLGRVRSPEGAVSLALRGTLAKTETQFR